MDKKEVLDILFWISLGVWVTCLFISIFYGNHIPMWVALIVMNVLNFARR